MLMCHIFLAWNHWTWSFCWPVQWILLRLLFNVVFFRTLVKFKILLFKETNTFYEGKGTITCLRAFQVICMDGMWSAFPRRGPLQIPRWWPLKSCLKSSPRSLGIAGSNLTIILFRWVGEKPPTTEVHPGRLTAGSPTAMGPMKRKENHRNQTSIFRCSMLIFRGVLK